MAPEVLASRLYRGVPVDIFACGVILFIIVAGHPPFNQAEPDDNHYRFLLKN